MDGTNLRSGSTKVVAFLIWLAVIGISPAGAAPITYTTQGQVWPWQLGDGGLSGTTGPSVISFQGVSTGTISPSGSSFSLGQLVVSLPPEGQSTTYNHAAFTITLNTSLSGLPVPASSGVVPYSSVQISGTLDGSVTSSGQSSVVAHIVSINPNPPVSVLDPSATPLLDMPFPLSALTVDSTVALAPVSPGSGATTTLWASVSAAPEPSSILVFLLCAAAVRFQLRWGHRRT
jgi:hypothetical protein